MNQNYTIETKAHNYLMMPGDGTMYRFGFQFYPETSKLDGLYNDAYVLDSGIKNGKGYIQAWINMSSSSGFGCIRLDDLAEFAPDSQYLVGYLRSHGFEHVYIYTLVAVLLALKHLVVTPDILEYAAQAMLDAPRYIRREYATT
jgi:hypothetical protein